MGPPFDCPRFGAEVTQPQGAELEGGEDPSLRSG
jgi:hypothetical protein